MWDPSRIFGSWEEVEFCSHHFHELWLKDGRLIVVPCRDQNEVLGRGRIQKGGLLTMEAGACNLKAYGQLWLLYFFHRRDLRLLALFICSVVPRFWMPTGLTSWSIHQKKEWMTNHDMLRIWNQVWVTNNPHMLEKGFIYSWGDLPYLPKGKDLKCGSLIRYTSHTAVRQIKKSKDIKKSNVTGRDVDVQHEHHGLYVSRRIQD